MGDCEENPSSKSQVDNQQQQEEKQVSFPSSDPPACHPSESDPTAETLDEEFHNLQLETKTLDEDIHEEEEEIVEEDDEETFKYPLRPDEPDCSFYLRTGVCRYGSNCRFNHPPRGKELSRSSWHFTEPVKFNPKVVTEEENENEKEEYPEREGQPDCKFYLKTGACKFGKTCRYHHPRERNVLIPAEQFNFLGLPIRPGEKECPFYMRMGSCKFANNCRFHHPDPTNAGGSDASSGYSAGTSQPPLTSWSIPAPSNGSVSYFDTSSSYGRGVVSPSEGTQHNLKWNGYQVPVNPVYPSQGHANPTLVKTNYGKKVGGSMLHQQQMTADAFPERPGERECQYYMRTGDCKYKSACRFDHPKNRHQDSVVLSPMGLPLRPDRAVCSNYNHYGICKYGPACKFDHPLSYAASTASLTTPVLSDSGRYSDFDGEPDRIPGSENVGDTWV